MQIQCDLYTQFQLTDDYVLLKPFLADAPISTPCKHQKTKGFSGAFKRYKMEALAKNS